MNPLPQSRSFIEHHHTAGWIRWSRGFERYRIASGLKIKPEYEQVSTLLYAMGDCADDILATLRLDETKATYDEVRTALNGYFDVRRNLIVQRALFNKRHQSVDTFIQDLYRLAEDCEYGSLKDGLIRDRIVVGVVDDSLSGRLQAKADLTLEMAVQMSRQAKAQQGSHSRKRYLCNGYRLYTCGFSGKSQKRFEISHETRNRSTVKART